VHEFLPVKHGNAKIPPRQIESNRSADNAPANDDDIVGFHANILSAISGAGFSLRGFVHLKSKPHKLKLAPLKTQRLN
jgi:hypothetical protein